MPVYKPVKRTDESERLLIAHMQGREEAANGYRTRIRIDRPTGMVDSQGKEIFERDEGLDAMHRYFQFANIRPCDEERTRLIAAADKET